MLHRIKPNLGLGQQTLDTGCIYFCPAASDQWVTLGDCTWKQFPFWLWRQDLVSPATQNQWCTAHGSHGSGWVMSARQKVEEREHILLHDEDDVLLGLKGIIELNEVHVVQLVHDANLILHILLRRRKEWIGAVETGPEGEETHLPAPLPCPLHFWS